MKNLKRIFIGVGSTILFVGVTYAAYTLTVQSTVKIDDSTANGPVLSNADQFGISVANIGDLNDDGVIDMAVGAYWDSAGGTLRGAVHILFMNTDGSVDSTVEINSTTPNGPTLANNSEFGRSVAGIGDLNSDGVEDIVVGAHVEDTGGSNRGAAFIMYLTTTGAVLSTVAINDNTANGPVLGDGDFFGTSVANIGDINDDGVTDIAVGATGDDEGGTARGTVHILFMNTDGSVDSTVEINSSTTNGPTLSDGDEFGRSVAGIGDVNGDEVEDIIVGAYADDEGGTARGTVHILFMNTNGSVDSTVEINSSTTNGPTLSDSDLFGFSVANMGDLNGDGVTDIAVGATGDDAGGDSRGTVHILFLNSDGSVDSTVEINSTTANGPTLGNVDYFGASVASMGDLDGNGVTDIVAGAYEDDEGGAARGAVHILFIDSVTLVSEESSPSGGTAYQHRRIRQRYAEIAAGLHGSATEEKNDTEQPSLSDVGIFSAGTGSIVKQETDEGGDEKKEGASLSRKVLKVLEKLQHIDEEDIERTPFQQRVCERVWRRFNGSSLERVNERLQRRLGFVCEE